ncbi:RDD family protein [Dactylosporangium sp. McL0621]|uniref:RDD family protein n=1 Tax=Dactylosporangium sp. McL0621 TaxID=3415678 RepID=UPI003CF637BD
MPRVPNGMPRANFGDRLLATPTVLGMVAAIAGAGATTSSSKEAPSAGLLFGRTGVTWGKRAMKLQLIRLDDLAAPVDRGVLAKRWATQSLVGAVVPFFSWVDGLWQLWDKPYQQCLRDKAAGTIVVKVG